MRSVPLIMSALDFSMQNPFTWFQFSFVLKKHSETALSEFKQRGRERERGYPGIFKIYETVIEILASECLFNMAAPLGKTQK